MVRVGLVGCGTIGSQLGKLIQRDWGNLARVVALNDIDRSKALTLQRRLTNNPPIVSLQTLIRKAQLVIEAASGSIAAEVVRRALAANRDVLVMSVGGLLSDSRWQYALRRSKARVYIPSGALAGIDGVRALSIGKILNAQLTTSKPPRGLASAPYVRNRGIRLERLRRPSVIFEGSAREVVRAFPQNTNVAATLTLASGIPASRVCVRVIADPKLTRNRHELDIEGDCGRIKCQVESRPSNNPKTSELAVRSAAAALERMFGRVSIGT